MQRINYPRVLAEPTKPRQVKSCCSRSKNISFVLASILIAYPEKTCWWPAADNRKATQLDTFISEVNGMIECDAKGSEVEL